MRFSKSGCYFPVDIPDIVAWEVTTDFLKIQTPTPKFGSVSTGKDTMDRMTGKEVESSGTVLQADQVT
jgi:hypothetical protein